MGIPGRKGSNSTILNKLTVIACSFSLCALLICNCSFPSCADDEVQWTLGYDRDINGMARGTQGSNGWYCYYTAQTNRHGSFNLGQMKEAVYGPTESNWKWYSTPKNWSPPEYLGSGYDSQEMDNWWLMDGHGRLDPNVSKGQMMSGAYAWKAPRKDTYSVSVDYTAGGSNETYDGETYYAVDGVTISINTKNGVKAIAECPATSESNRNLTSGNLTKILKVNAGDMIYFIVDPQSNGSYATAMLCINITTSIDPPDEDETGNGEGDDNGNGEGEQEGNTLEKQDKEEDQKPAPSGQTQGSGGNGKDSGPGPAPKAPAVTKENTEKKKPEAHDSKYFIIKGKTLEAVPTEAVESLKEDSGGTGETEDIPEPQIPFYLIGLVEVLGGGAMVSIGRFIKVK